MVLLFEAVRRSWVRGDDDAVLLAGAGLLGGVDATSQFVGLSTDCSTRRLLMESFSAAGPRKLFCCVMESEREGEQQRQCGPDRVDLS